MIPLRDGGANERAVILGGGGLMAAKLVEVQYPGTEVGFLESKLFPGYTDEPVDDLVHQQDLLVLASLVKGIKS